MKAKALITISSFLLLIFSCKKENADVVYGATYMKSATQTLSEIRYYSRNGNIDIKSIPAIWIDNDTARFNFLTTSIRTPGFLDSLKFINSQEAISKYYNSETKYTMEKTGSRMILTEKNIIGYHSTYADEYTKSPQYYLLQYKPEVFDEWIISSIRGAYLFGYSTKQKVVVEINGDKLFLPIIYYQQHRNGQTINSSYLNNNLQKDFYKNIMAGDTIAVMEARLIYMQK